MAIVSIDREGNRVWVCDSAAGFSMMREGGVWRTGVATADELMEVFESPASRKEEATLYQEALAEFSSDPERFKLPSPLEKSMTLEKAIQIAADAHEGAKDKAGAPYVLHPLRMMMKMDTDESRLVAILHDVAEDAHPDKGFTLEWFRSQGLNDSIILALDALTHRDGEDYNNYINRVAQNQLAVKVKLADLEDNMDISRINMPGKKDFDRLEKYALTYQRLKALADR
jgi:(p)ppGpp synthase/HD superfamily hydrolase